MATTDIHAITQTVDQALKYGMSDKVENTIKDDIADSIRYAVNDKTGEVTYKTLSGTLNCSNFDNPITDFKFLMKKYGDFEIKYGNAQTKDGKPILAWHLIQSFEENEVDPITANTIGLKLAEEIFKGHPVVVSTHTNTENIHNHIIVCAWNRDGKKWHQCNENYRNIRETSDRICDEYGLSVLEHTRKQKLYRWTDGEGKLRYYEPTDRKNALIQKRREGRISPDDVNSYRNTIPYEIAIAKKETNVEIVKRAIDEKLPYATSYDHLLSMMREMGFKVKSKKKNGEWLSHITFTPPTAEKGVRDYKIRDDGYYTRQNLIKLIEERNQERIRNEELQQRLHIPYYEKYEYGKVNVDELNEEYRLVKNYDYYKVVQRKETERILIQDIKKCYHLLEGGYDTSGLERLIEENKEKEKGYPKEKDNTDDLIKQIQEGWDNLRFIEEKPIESFLHLEKTIASLKEQASLFEEEIIQATMMIDKLEGILNAPQEVKEIQERMERLKDDPEYMIEQYSKDLRSLKGNLELIEKNQLDTPEGEEKLEESIDRYKRKADTLKNLIKDFEKDLVGYERCVRVFNRIEMERQQKIQKEQRKEEQQQEMQTRFVQRPEEKKKKKQKGRER